MYKQKVGTYAFLRILFYDALFKRTVFDTREEEQSLQFPILIMNFVSFFLSSLK